MKLSNPLKSLTWNSLFRLSRSRLRRRLPSAAPLSLAAEVLEERVLLQGGTGTVNVQQVGTALVVTADANSTAGTSPVVTIYRLNPTTVEVDGEGSTLIAKNGAFNSAASSQTFAINSLAGVSSITVNLGTGYDEFFIRDLNVLGGITFVGKSGGGTGDRLEVFNDSSNAMTIGGGITVRGNTLGSALAHSGSIESDFRLYTSSTGNLTVGSVSASQSNSGSAQQKNQLYTDGDGNLKILGAVTLTLTQTGTGYQQNDIYTNSGSGNLSIGLGVVESATGGTGGAGTSEGDNYIVTNFNNNGATGNVTIGLGVTETASASYSGQNYIYTHNTSGNISIGQSVTFSATQSNSGSYNQADNFIETQGSGSGSVKIGGSVTLNNTGTSVHFNQISTDTGTGGITIGLGVTFNDSGSTNYSQNEIFTRTGNIKVGLGVTINQMAASTGDNNLNYVFTDGTGSLTIGGVVKIKATDSGSSSYYTSNFVFSSGGTGSLSALGVTITDSGSQLQISGVGSDVGAVTIGLLGVSINGSGSGDHYNYLYVNNSSSNLKISGAVFVTETTTGFQWLDIRGAYFGSAVTVTMNGSEAEIHINDGDGFQTTEFKGLFTATMTGSNPVIVVADGTFGSSNSPVLFDLGALVVGSFGGGGTFEYDSVKVLFFNNSIFGPTLINFTKVLS